MCVERVPKISANVCGAVSKRTRENRRNHAAGIHAQREIGHLPAHHLAAHDALGVLHRNAPLAAFDEDDEGDDRDHQRKQGKHGDRRERTPLLRLDLDPKIRNRGRQADHDAGENDERHAVADAAIADLLAEPHDERRAGGQRQHRHQHEAAGPDDRPATDPDIVWLSSVRAMEND